MKRLLLLLLHLFVLFPLCAQNYQIFGVISDSFSREPLPHAGITLFSDQRKPVLTQQADSLGHFSLTIHRAGNYKLRVTYIGYHMQEIPLTLTKSQHQMGLDTILLENVEQHLEGAVVTAVASRVQQKGDTTVFNAAAYRTAEGATLEALVKQLPGVKVSEDGAITLNGKPIKELLVNGKDFFKGKNDVALQNLPVDLVNRIKAYNKKSDYAEQTGIDDQEDNPVLDISTKRELNSSYFAHANLGYGTKDRYKTSLFASRFTEKSRVGVFMRIGNTSRRMSRGLTDYKMVGADFNFTNGKKKYSRNFLEMGGSAYYNYRTNHLEQTTNAQTFLANDRSSFKNSQMNNYQRNLSFSADYYARWSPDSLTTLNLRHNFSYNEGSGKSNSLSATFNDDPFEVTENPLEEAFLQPLPTPLAARVVNTNEQYSKQLSDGRTAGMELGVVRRFNALGRNLSFTLNGNLGQQHQRNFNMANTTYHTLEKSKEDFRNRYQTTPGKNYAYAVKAAYVEPLSKLWRIHVNYDFSYGYRNNDRSAYLLNRLDDEAWKTFATSPVLGTLPETDKLLDAVRDDNNSRYSTYRDYNHNVRLGVNYKVEAHNLNLSLSARPQRTTLDYVLPGRQIDTVITRHVFYLAPQVDWRWKWNKTTTFRLNYGGRQQLPSMTNLLAVVDDSNPLQVSMGNPELKPSWTDNVSAELMYGMPEKEFNLMLNSSYSQTRHAVSNRMIYDPNTGARFDRPENINGNWKYNLSGGFSIGMAKEHRLTLSSYTYFGFSHQKSYVSSLPQKNLAVALTAFQHPRAATATDMDYYDRLFSDIHTDQNTLRTMNWSEQLTLNYRLGLFDVALLGDCDYQQFRNSIQSSRNLSTWQFSYGTNLNYECSFGLSLNTSLRMSSRRGYSDNSMNTNELMWDFSASQSLDFLLKGLRLNVEWNDILHQRSNISRIFNANMRSDSRSNAITSYGMISLFYRFQLIPGGGTAKGGKSNRPQGRGRGRMGRPMSIMM